MKYRPDPILKKFASFFTEAGFACYLVGGAVRNAYCGFPVSDYDFATDALPEDVIRIFRKVIPTGIKHGTVTVLFSGHKFEVTTFRQDGKYSDSRRPDNVEYTSSLFEDLKRRDFTMNAMAYNLADGELVDPHNGRGDIDNKIIRAIGEPSERFEEDALRIMRGCRFVSQLGFSIDQHTLKGMSDNASRLSLVSAERIRDELDKILLTRKPSESLRIMESTGVLKVVLPELAECRGVEQKGYHDFDVLDHLFLSCDGAPSCVPEVRLAALLHDTGKPGTLESGEDGIPSFHGHEVLSGKIAEAIMERFKYPKAFEAAVLHLIVNHMFNYTPEWSDAAVRRFLARVGTGSVDNLFMLRRADQYGMSGKPVDSGNLAEFSMRIKKVLAADNALSIRDLSVNGNILSEKAGIPKGPVMGDVLDFLLDTVLDDPSQNSEPALLILAENFYKKRLKP